ncbi:SAM-dependent methyltransferase [Nodosilinea sp. FACHB-131]|uniref:SAM-dependent methyltransferase n=1 Tax=Cyanophyceae TaxID=3028117 RepID=UPI0016863347|nr:SAM-dependent methyltransferase [Nodosilinea sp. FACHB-131]MBD1874004.1 SAM-dependent methyltransferase [Nodosilinea sp. FACHB-131]
MSQFNLFPCDKSLEGLVSNLKDKYGYQETRLEQKPVGANQEPLPWFTYPAIEYLAQLDLSDKSIFEWGSGNSSQFFASRCKQITSIESDPEWYEYGSQRMLPNQKILFQEEAVFAEAIDESFSKFDLIIIDSLRRHDCALRAINHLNDGGFIILDNSDWHPKTSEFLRVVCDLIEVDMHGFGPINPYSWTTSLYLRRDFRFTPKDGIQPKVSKAGIHQISEYDSRSKKN